MNYYSDFFGSFGQHDASYRDMMDAINELRRRQRRKRKPYWEPLDEDYNPFQTEPVVIHKPIYKHPEPIRTKIRRFELPSISMSKKVNTWKVATNQKDNVSYRIEVEGEGFGEIPKSITDKIRLGYLIIVEEEGGDFIYQGTRRIKREFWSLKRLLWECLKESQYVEFEEIKADSL